jgi:membrane protease YdiL (CAAX protease family)
MAQMQAVSLVNPRPFSAQSKLRDLIEIAVAFGLILTVIWTPRPWQQLLWWIALVAVLTMICLSFESLSAMGLRAANFFRSLWVVGLALGLSGVAMLLAAGMHTLRVPANPILFVKSFGGYIIWAGVQQFLLQCFFLSRLQRLIPNQRSVVWIAAALFAVAHLPNPLLTAVTVLWGVTACLFYLRYRNLYPLMIAHAILGIAIAITVPGPVDHNMRVGLGYLTYGSHGQPHRAHWLRVKGCRMPLAANAEA